MAPHKENTPTGKKPGLYDRFLNANREHPVIMNIIYIIITATILVWLLLLFLDSWTHHGEEATVPSLKGQSVELASMNLANDGFTCEVMDSVFESTHKPGTVVEQNPSAGAKVKPGRTVYVTIVAYSPKMVSVPDFMNVSQRQGRSMFEGLGLEVNIVTVASQYKDLVLGAKVNGVPLRPGQRLPVTAKVTLEVGGGDEPDDNDTDPVTYDDGSTLAPSGDSDSDTDEDPTLQRLLQ